MRQDMRGKEKDRTQQMRTGQEKPERRGQGQEDKDRTDESKDLNSNKAQER